MLKWVKGITFCGGVVCVDIYLELMGVDILRLHMEQKHDLR